jgi:hypothetical protein
MTDSAWRDQQTADVVNAAADEDEVDELDEDEDDFEGEDD